MSTRMEIFIFGNQATDYHTNLRTKLRQKSNPLLTSFLERANAALREEIAQQPRLIRDTIPEFSTLIDLVEWFEESDVSNPAMESAICCICQISCFIRLAGINFLCKRY